AGYGMTSGSTPAEGITAPMLFYDPAHPPAESQIAGRILVFQTQKQPAPPYNENFLDNYTPTDYEWRSPGKWPELFVPPPLAYGTSFKGRWEWSQVNRFAGDRHQGEGRRHRHRLRPVAGDGSRPRAAQRLHRERTRRSWYDLHQLPDPDARSRQRRE